MDTLVGLRMRLVSIMLVVAYAAFPAELRITDARLHQYEDGPALPASHRFRAGEMIHLSFRITGYQVKDQRVALAYRIEGSDPDKVPFAPAHAGHIREELADEDKDWTPKVRWSAMIPDTPAPGAYRLLVAVEDEFAGRKVQTPIDVRVDAPPIEAAATLGLRHFGFYRSEEAADPLPPGGAFRPGDVVWARFEIAGYQFGEKNQYAVGYSVLLRDAGGKVLFERPAAAAQEDASFYRRRRLPAALSLNLDKRVTPGEYVLIIRLTDALAKATIESEHRFRVEP